MKIHKKILIMFTAALALLVICSALFYLNQESIARYYLHVLYPRIKYVNYNNERLLSICEKPILELEYFRDPLLEGLEWDYNRTVYVDYTNFLIRRKDFKVEEIRNLLRSRNKYARINAIKILTKVNDRDSFKDILKLADEPSGNVRLEVLKHSKQLSEDPVSLLSHFSRDDESYIRQRAIREIAGLRTEESRKALYNIYRESDKENRLQVISSIKSIILETGKTEQIQETFESIFLMALGDSDTNVRTSAYELLSRCNSDKIVNRLIMLLKSRDKNVKKDAAMELGRIGDRKAVPSLIKALEDPECFDEAISAMGKTGDNDTFLKLLNLLSSGNEEKFNSEQRENISKAMKQIFIRNHSSYN